MKKPTWLAIIFLLLSGMVGLVLAQTENAGPAMPLAGAEPGSGNPVTSTEEAASATEQPVEAERVDGKLVSPGLAEIVKLAQSNLDEKVVIAFIENSNVPYQPTSEELLYLNDIGLSPNVVTALIKRGKVLREEAKPIVGNAPPAEPARPKALQPATRNPVSSAATAIVESTLTETVVETTSHPEAVAAAETVSESPAYFYDNLAPYGTWVNMPECGWVWQPSVAVQNATWRPYFDRGHWVYTDAGWYWMSDYSWGWAPFHYGRWWNHPQRGWLWLPGTTWAPSWVCWRRTPVYCGWAPLPPQAVYEPEHGFVYLGGRVGPECDFGISLGHFSFVHYKNVMDRNLHLYCLPPRQVQPVFVQSVVVNKYVWGRDRVVMNQGLDPAHIKAFTRAEVKVIPIRPVPPGSPGKVRDRLDRSAGVLYRPQLAANPPPVPHLAPGRNSAGPGPGMKPPAAGDRGSTAPRPPQGGVAGGPGGGTPPQKGSPPAGAPVSGTRPNAGGIDISGGRPPLGGSRGPGGPGQTTSSTAPPTASDRQPPAVGTRPVPGGGNAGAGTAPAVGSRRPAGPGQTGSSTTAPTASDRQPAAVGTRPAPGGGNAGTGTAPAVGSRRPAGPGQTASSTSPPPASDRQPPAVGTRPAPGGVNAGTGTAPAVGSRGPGGPGQTASSTSPPPASDRQPPAVGTRPAPGGGNAGTGTAPTVGSRRPAGPGQATGSTTQPAAPDRQPPAVGTRPAPGGGASNPSTAPTAGSRATGGANPNPVSTQPPPGGSTKSPGSPPTASARPWQQTMQDNSPKRVESRSAANSSAPPTYGGTRISPGGSSSPDGGSATRSYSTAPVRGSGTSSGASAPSVSQPSYPASRSAPGSSGSSFGTAPSRTYSSPGASSSPSYSRPSAPSSAPSYSTPATAPSRSSSPPTAPSRGNSPSMGTDSSRSAAQPSPAARTAPSAGGSTKDPKENQDRRR